ncbi:MAG: methyltransferase domain-containing protein [Pseudonocardiales bacterium]|nr:methyltransferase domain-containing protein [Pseudonocardiales bacterium]
MTVHPQPELPLTGERTVPGVARENYWFRRHQAVYQELVPHCVDAVVLEAGCGEGYGADLLAAAASRVLALDCDAVTVAHVGHRYPRIAAALGNLVALPLGSSVVDVVVSLQVIEHLWEQERFLAECARVLRLGGRLLLSTPNRLTFSPERDSPLNPFHTRELSPAELVELLRAAGFDVSPLLGLRHGGALRELDARHGGSFVDAQVAMVLDGGPWPAALLADVAGVRCADFELSSADLDTSLDLVAIARARGGTSS